MKLNAALDAELEAYKNTYNPFPPLSDEERDKHIRKIFGEFDSLEKIDRYGYEYWKVFKCEILLGYLSLIEHDIKCGKCTDVRFYIGIDRSKKVKGISLVNKINLYGKMIEGEKLFHQFSGISFKKYQNINIRWITGATQSSKGIEEGIANILSIVNENE